MGLGNPQQDENLMREYCDERTFVGKTILLNTGGSCSGVRKKYLYIIKMIFGVYVVGKS